MTPLFPTGLELKELLNLGFPAELDDLLSRSLLEPIKDLFSRPKKDLRSELVLLGFKIAARKLKARSQSSNFFNLLPDACEILETLHAGSLIVDDIEDQTLLRRGQDTLHLKYGLPVALNAGNWLYFLPFRRIDRLPITESYRARLAKECQNTLLLAHYGQALDVGVSVDSLSPARIPEVAMATIELKSGVLTGFALKIGAILLGADEETLNALDTCGRKLGVSLQMFDDIGNLTSKNNLEKRGEDLKLLRPCFIFSIASQNLSEKDFSHLIALLKENKNVEAALAFLSRHKIPEIAKETARSKIVDMARDCQNQLALDTHEISMLETITQRLVDSYE